MGEPDYYKSIVDAYQDAYASDHVLHGFIQRALPFLPPNSNILDVGCGTGKPLDMLLVARGHKVEGIDKSPTMIDFSRKNVPEGNFQVADMCTYERPIEGQNLDAIFNVRALFRDTREEIETCVSNWAKWLKPQGLLCMVVLAADDYNPAKVEQYDSDGYSARVKRRFMGTDEHCVLFSRIGWEYLLRVNGLETLDEKMELFVPPENADSDEAAQYCFVARKL